MIIFAQRHYLWRGKDYLVHSTYNDGTCDLIDTYGNLIEDVPKKELEAML